METKTEITSKQYAINWKDAVRGLIVAVGTAILTVIYTSVEAGNFNFDWKMLVKVGAASGLAYIMKNFFQPAQVKQTIPNDQVDSMIDSTKAAK